jgi:hypothetical protein
MRREYPWHALRTSAHPRVPESTRGPRHRLGRLAACRHDSRMSGRGRGRNRRWRKCRVPKVECRMSESVVAARPLHSWTPSRGSTRTPESSRRQELHIAYRVSRIACRSSFYAPRSTLPAPRTAAAALAAMYSPRRPPWPRRGARWPRHRTSHRTRSGRARRCRAKACSPIRAPAAR